MDDDDRVPYGLYECDSCGACCKGPFIVEADYVDVRREPRLLDRQVGRHKVTQRDLEEDDKVALVACGAPCPWLGADNRCTIYATRPNVCVDFDAGSHKCQEARGNHGQPRLMPKLPILSNAS